VTIQYLFGILACSDHKEWAVRDCNAYMHKNNMVKIKDAMKIPGLAECLAELNEVGERGDLIVQRSNGDIEKGWSVVNTSYDCLIVNEKINEWTINMTNGTVQKYVPLRWFLDSRVPVSHEHVKRSIDVLTKGVYKNDYFKQLEHSMEAKDVVELPCIGKAILNGQVVRALFP